LRRFETRALFIRTWWSLKGSAHRRFVRVHGNFKLILRYFRHPPAGIFREFTTYNIMFSLVYTAAGPLMGHCVNHSFMWRLRSLTQGSFVLLHYEARTERMEK
jgi:hypothetical protein